MWVSTTSPLPSSNVRECKTGWTEGGKPPEYIDAKGFTYCGATLPFGQAFGWISMAKINTLSSDE